MRLYFYVELLLITICDDGIGIFGNFFLEFRGYNYKMFRHITATRNLVTYIVVEQDNLEYYDKIGGAP